jgi:hypothetical protein
MNNILCLCSVGLSVSKTIYFTSANKCVEFISRAYDVIQIKVVLSTSYPAALLQAKEHDSIPESDLS